MTNQKPNKQRSLEEAVTELRKPEVRGSLENYVIATMDEGLGNYEGLLEDVVHFTVDLKAEKYGYTEEESTFIHELVDMKSEMPSLEDNPEGFEAYEGRLYQKGKSYILEHCDTKDFIETAFDLYIKMKSSDEENRAWRDEMNQEGKFFGRCISALSDLGWCIDEDREKLKEKVKGRQPPMMKGFPDEYIEAVKERKEELGLKIDSPPLDVSILKNGFLKYAFLGTFNFNPISSRKFYNRFYEEAVQEILGLKDSLLDIGRKYGVEMKLGDIEK